MIQGSCLCGEVAFEADALSGPIGHCHCRTCRKTHAAAFATTAGVLREHFRWLRGESALGSFESSPGKLRHFCRNCGTHLIAERIDQPSVILRMGAVDEGPDSLPAGHIWVSDALPWLRYGPELPHFSEGVGSPLLTGDDPGGQV